MDADLSHNPKYIPRFIELAKKNNYLIVASRYIKGGGTPDWSLYRKLQSRLVNLYAGYVLGTDITDYTGGFNMYNRHLLKKF
jgi:dolichol-phosphate mannosyltransferase